MPELRLSVRYSLPQAALPQSQALPALEVAGRHQQPCGAHLLLLAVLVDRRLPDSVVVVVQVHLTGQAEQAARPQIPAAAPAAAALAVLAARAVLMAAAVVVVAFLMVERVLLEHLAVVVVELHQSELRALAQQLLAHLVAPVWERRAALAV